jgi:hypothetical protein
LATSIAAVPHIRVVGGNSGQIQIGALTLGEASSISMELEHPDRIERAG